MTVTTIPARAITAATQALHHETLKVPCPEDRDIAMAMLEAAAPYIAAAECRRVRHFIKLHAGHTTSSASCVRAILADLKP